MNKLTIITITTTITTKMGHFLFAAKAFDVLERLDPDPEYWEGKRGACVVVIIIIFIILKLLLLIIKSKI